MGLIIFFIVAIYLFFGAMIGGAVDDLKNDSIADGVLANKNIGVPLCIFLWPLLIILFAIITALNAAYLLGKKLRRKWWNK